MFHVAFNVLFPYSLLVLRRGSRLGGKQRHISC
jgi:hypothetical protein